MSTASDRLLELARRVLRLRAPTIGPVGIRDKSHFARFVASNATEVKRKRDFLLLAYSPLGLYSYFSGDGFLLIRPDIPSLPFLPVTAYAKLEFVERGGRAFVVGRFLPHPLYQFFSALALAMPLLAVASSMWVVFTTERTLSLPDFIVIVIALLLFGSASFMIFNIRAGVIDRAIIPEIHRLLDGYRRDGG